MKVQEFAMKSYQNFENIFTLSGIPLTDSSYISNVIIMFGDILRYIGNDFNQLKYPMRRIF